MSPLTDHDLTALVEAAASGAVNAQAAHHGGDTWDDMHPSIKNAIRENALPFIYHGTKALEELGYTKPRIIMTAADLDALKFESVVLDAYGTPYVCERHRTDGTRNEWKPSGMSHLDESETLLYHGPVTVIHGGRS